MEFLCSLLCTYYRTVAYDQYNAVARSTKCFRLYYGSLKHGKQLTTAAHSEERGKWKVKAGTRIEITEVKKSSMLEEYIKEP
jgi:hypothetical protein